MKYACFNVEIILDRWTGMQQNDTSYCLNEGEYARFFNDMMNRKNLDWYEKLRNEWAKLKHVDCGIYGMRQRTSLLGAWGVRMGPWGWNNKTKAVANKHTKHDKLIKLSNMYNNHHHPVTIAHWLWHIDNY